MKTLKIDKGKISSVTNANEDTGKTISGAVAVLEVLIAEGVDTIFGYPGGAIIPIYDALYDYHTKLKHLSSQ